MTPAGLGGGAGVARAAGREGGARAQGAGRRLRKAKGGRGVWGGCCACASAPVKRFGGKGPLRGSKKQAPVCVL